MYHIQYIYQGKEIITECRGLTEVRKTEKWLKAQGLEYRRVDMIALFVAKAEQVKADIRATQAALKECMIP